MKRMGIGQLRKEITAKKIIAWGPVEITADGKVVGTLLPRGQEGTLAVAGPPQSTSAESWGPVYVPDAKAPRVNQLRSQVFDMLGRKCQWCGFTDERALQIDHVNGGGTRERHGYSSDTTYYKHILDVKGMGYQTLCANCNWIKARGGKPIRQRQDGTLAKLVPQFSKEKQVAGTMRR